MLPDTNIVLDVEHQCGDSAGHDPCRSSDCAICGSAAGALQNVSREVASRMIIREMDTVCPLADLLSSSDLQVTDYSAPNQDLSLLCRCYVAQGSTAHIIAQTEQQAKCYVFWHCRLKSALLVPY